MQATDRRPDAASWRRWRVKLGNTREMQNSRSALQQAALQRDAGAGEHNTTSNMVGSKASVLCHRGMHAETRGGLHHGITDENLRVMSERTLMRL